MGHDSNYAETVRLVVCMSPNLVLPSEFGLLWPQNFKAELQPLCSPQIQMDGHLTKHFYEQNFMSWGFGTILTHFGQNWGQKSHNLSSKNQIFEFVYNPWIRELTRLYQLHLLCAQVQSWFLVANLYILTFTTKNQLWT